MIDLTKMIEQNQQEWIDIYKKGYHEGYQDGLCRKQEMNNAS